MSEMKPVKCGCGGEAVVGHIEKTSYLPKDRWYIGCPKCDICTGIYDTEAEAITAWNRAMSGAKDINVPDKFATDMNVGNKERTAKAEWSEVDGCHLCGECGFAVCPNCDVYCAGCGARLEWE